MDYIWEMIDIYIYSTKCDLNNKNDYFNNNKCDLCFFFNLPKHDDLTNNNVILWGF